VVAVDASHSRLYVFEQQPHGLQLIRSFYASIGQAGFDKRVEGDLRTPLGVYFITSRLDDQQVEELYGIGALPLNYPNEHDRRLGRTGSGIWLHGVPRATYSRSPYATEGCVALANDDMAYLMAVLQTRRTPVIVADELKWATPTHQTAERHGFEALLTQWQQARARNDVRNEQAGCRLTAAYLRPTIGDQIRESCQILENNYLNLAKIQPTRRSMPGICTLLDLAA
jgi:murein L,D-transpeptidase YafK